jgi:hypothetical protein
VDPFSFLWIDVLPELSNFVAKPSSKVGLVQVWELWRGSTHKHIVFAVLERVLSVQSKAACAVSELWVDGLAPFLETTTVALGV